MLVRDGLRLHMLLDRLQGLLRGNDAAVKPK